MVKTAQSIIISTTPVRAFKNQKGSINALAVLPDGRRIVTSTYGDMVRLWDLKDGAVVKKMEGHPRTVRALAVSRDGQLIASGDDYDFFAWHGEAGESLTQAFRAHSDRLYSLEFSPDGAVLASGSRDKTTKLWSTETWQLQGNPMECHSSVSCVRYSPSGEHIAIATDSDIQIWSPGTRECIAKFKAHVTINLSLAWTPDGTRLLSGGTTSDPTVREWDASTWQQVGDPWEGHNNQINAIAVNYAGTLVASASRDHYVRLWRLSDQRTIAIFKHSNRVCCVTFSVDSKHILSGGDDAKISEWAVPKDTVPEDGPEEQASKVS